MDDLYISAGHTVSVFHWSYYECISVGHTMDVMYFAWLPSPVDVDGNVQLPQFTLEDTILHDCSQNYTAGETDCKGHCNKNNYIY